MIFNFEKSPLIMVSEQACGELWRLPWGDVMSKQKYEPLATCRAIVGVVFYNHINNYYQAALAMGLDHGTIMYYVKQHYLRMEDRVDPKYRENYLAYKDLFDSLMENIT